MLATGVGAAVLAQEGGGAPPDAPAVGCAHVLVAVPGEAHGVGLLVDENEVLHSGGAIAVGHPFAATGARIVANLGKLLSQQGGRGLISICTAGGMGVAAIMETKDAAELHQAA